MAFNPAKQLTAKVGEILCTSKEPQRLNFFRFPPPERMRPRPQPTDVRKKVLSDQPVRLLIDRKMAFVGR
jgi:hypothetical protein